MMTWSYLGVYMNRAFKARLEFDLLESYSSSARACEKHILAGLIKSQQDRAWLELAQLNQLLNLNMKQAQNKLSVPIFVCQMFPNTFVVTSLSLIVGPF